MVTRKKLPVSTSALIRRINRQLKKDQKMVRATREGRAREELGSHFVVDLSKNGIVRHHIDLEEFGREVGVLLSWEGCEDDK